MTTLRVAVEKLLIEISKLIESPKLKLVYLVNCYEQVTSTIAIPNNNDYKRFQKLIDDCIKNYVELELAEHFSKFISFVTLVEPQVSNSNNADSKPKVSTQEMEEHAKEFEKKSKDGLLKIHAEITRNFPNLDFGKKVLQAVMTRMLVYYNLFMKIVNTCYPNTPQRANLLNDQRILGEFKKLTKEFL